MTTENSAEETPLSTPPGSQAPRIFLVVADMEVADRLTDLLEAQGYEIELATSWQYAMILAERGGDLVIMDTNLPDVTASEATQVLRNVAPFAGLFAHAAILYLVDRANVVSQRFGHHQSIPADYIFKPVDEELLLGRVTLSLEK